jgi:O-antigen/teichoic acid export membrane protein
MAAAFIVFLIALPSGLASRVLGGYQEVHAANVFTMGGSLLSLAAVILVIRIHGSLAMLVAAYAGSMAGANAICLLWICVFRKPWLKPSPSRIQRNLIGGIFHSGSQFFLIQIAGLVVFNSDNLVISHYLSPAQVTPYNVTWRIASYITAIQLLAYPALWPAYSEAYAKGDLAWIRRAYARNRWITLATLAVGCGVLLSAGRKIILLWAGPAAVPSASLLRLMCVWMVIFAIATNQSCLMGATNHIRKQAIFAVLGAAVNLALSVHWVKTMGVPGVLLGTVASYLLFIVIAQTIEVRGILRGHATIAAG